MEKMVSLSWASHSKDLTLGIWKLFQQNFKSDFEISVNGSYIKAHQLILAVFCPVIKQATNNTFIIGEDCEIMPKDVECLIEFLYRGQIDVKEDRLPALRVAAEHMGMKVLADIISKYITEIKARGMRKDLQEKLKTTRNCPEFINIKKPAGQLLKLPSVQVLNRVESGKKVRAKSASLVGKMSDSFKNKSELILDESGSNLVTSRSRRRASCRLGLSKDAFDPGSLLYKCKHCEEGFATAVDFYNHVRTHENRDLKYHCKFCDYKSEQSTSLKHHLMVRHQKDEDGNELQKNFKCPHCPFACAANFRLKNHVYQVHEGKTKVCDMCGYRCASYAVLNKHKSLVHSDARPYMCESCGYRAKSFPVFRNHMRIHYGQKVSCDVCDSSMSLTQMKAHKRIHMAVNRSHACHLCSFTSWRKYNLKMHLKNVHKIIMEEESQLQQSAEFDISTDVNVDLKLMECGDENV